MHFLKAARTIRAGACLLLLAACANDPGIQVSQAAPVEAAQPAEDAKPVVCTNPRPQACTMDYQPVCATRDTGIRCVTTPCPSSERKTYSNGCGACSDPKVSEYIPGACAAAAPNAVDGGAGG